jgi:sterol desaturase/sphingolipid hydroxylase (fatty acid hydroxylase superfamily)
MRFFVSRLFFPFAILVTMASFLYARATGAGLELAVILPSAAVLLLAMLFERLLPFRAEWNRPRGDARTDLTSAGVLFAVVDPALKWLLPFALATLYGGADSMPGPALFPTGLPFALQLTVAALLAEFGGYWAHRLHHTHRALWWLHALHHGSERLYALNKFRIHPLNYAITYACGMLPLLLIGTPADVLYGYLALTYPVLMLQHANLPLRSGVLNYVFSTNEVHRWHHSGAPGEGDSNFGRALVIWDIAFRTFRYRPGANMPETVGLYRGSAYPAKDHFWCAAPDCCG